MNLKKNKKVSLLFFFKKGRKERLIENKKFPSEFLYGYKELEKEGFVYHREYTIMIVPNIVDISYGRGVGYTFTEHDLGKEIHSISATKIRAKMREDGDL